MAVRLLDRHAGEIGDGPPCRDQGGKIRAGGRTLMIVLLRITDAGLRAIGA